MRYSTNNSRNSTFFSLAAKKKSDFGSSSQNIVTISIYLRIHTEGSSYRQFSIIRATRPWLCCFAGTRRARYGTVPTVGPGRANIFTIGVWQTQKSRTVVTFPRTVPYEYSALHVPCRHDFTAELAVRFCFATRHEHTMRRERITDNLISPRRVRSRRWASNINRNVLEFGNKSCHVSGCKPFVN